MMIADEMVEIDEVEEDALGNYSGYIRIYRDTSKVCIEAVAPERVPH